MNKAVFFDRDGVINELVERLDGSHTAPWTVDEFRFKPNAGAAIASINHKFKTFVVTNQPDINDGNLKQSDLDIMSKMLTQWLHIDEVVCSTERNSDFYKPNNGMIEHLINKYNIDRNNSWLIGDRWKDIVAGHNSRIKTIFVGNVYTYPVEYRNIYPDYECKDILDACKLIMKRDKND